MDGIERIRGKTPVAMTIAGSDSGGGAGIQADLKTFAALGVHGTAAITSITAQNTKSVTAVQDVDPEVIRKQIVAVAEDIGIDAAKTGMLHTEEIIKAVSSEIGRYNLQLVVDPVMIAKSGAHLLKPEAIDAMKLHILPKATVVTPNRFEAERLTGIEVRTIDDAKNCAEKICELGPQAVVIKGGHLNGEESVDILYYRSRFKLFSAPRINVKTTHGTGCSFSAAIAAELAKGEEVPTAIETAKSLVTTAIRFGIDVGKGHGPVNPMAYLYRESARYNVLKDLDNARLLIESTSSVVSLVPEVGMNIAMATPYAENLGDVAAIEGRIVKLPGRVKAVGHPSFGCSSHLAKYILEASRRDPTKRAAINLRFSDEILKALEARGLRASSYDRKEEPEEIKKIEGMTIPWGMRKAIERIGDVPDFVYHRGDVGKEPMIVVLGHKASGLAELVVQLSKEISP